MTCADKRSIVFVIAAAVVGISVMAISAKAQDARPESHYTVRTLPLADNGTGDVSMALATAPIAAQAPASAQAQNTAAYKAPRTPWGHPDLQGVWANNNATSLERPKEIADKAFFTDEEVATLKAEAARLFDGKGDAAFGDAVFLAAIGKLNKLCLDGRPDGQLPVVLDRGPRLRQPYVARARTRRPHSADDARGAEEGRRGH